RAVVQRLVSTGYVNLGLCGDYAPAQRNRPWPDVRLRPIGPPAARNRLAQLSAGLIVSVGDSAVWRRSWSLAAGGGPYHGPSSHRSTIGSRSLPQKRLAVDEDPRRAEHAAGDRLLALLARDDLHLGIGDTRQDHIPVDP